MKSKSSMIWFVGPHPLSLQNPYEIIWPLYHSSSYKRERNKKKLCCDVLHCVLGSYTSLIFTSVWPLCLGGVWSAGLSPEDIWWMGWRFVSLVEAVVALPVQQVSQVALPKRSVGIMSRCHFADFEAKLFLKSLSRTQEN